MTINGRVDFVIPECYIDTNLVETLVCHGGCNHQKGCNQVAKIMKEKFSDRFAVGIIDADKRRPGYLQEFQTLGSSEHLQLLSHIQLPHFMLIVAPAADGFILSCAESSGIDVAEYGLSPILKEFTEQTKNVLSNKDPRFKKLFCALKDCDEIQLFTSILQKLIAENYQISTQSLAELFKHSNRTI